MSQTLNLQLLRLCALPHFAQFCARTLRALICLFRHPLGPCLAALFGASLLPRRASAGDTNLAPFRLGFSSTMFADVNENDARASVKVWGQSVASEHGIPVDPAPNIYRGIPALRRALMDRTVDCLALTCIEFAELSRDVPFAPIFVNCIAGRFTEQYVLLSHAESSIASLPDLRGRSLTVHANFRSCLALPWLDTLLVQQDLTPAAQFLAKISHASQLSKAVLPVFFRQSDACLVTRGGFETMSELNPQVGKRLKLLATSPAVVPSLFCFRADYDPPFKEALFAGIRDLHKSPAGQQILTVFQSDQIQDRPVSCLNSALDLLALYQRRSAPAPATLLPPPLSSPIEAHAK